MSKGAIKVKSESWWAQKSTLEKVLLLIVAACIILIVVLIVLVAKRSDPGVPTTNHDVCSKPECITEAAKILEHVDPDMDPCTNLYQYACGTFLKNSHGDEKLALFHKLAEQVKRESLELYKENNKGTDHKMVKAARNLFRACLNDTEIARDNLKTIREAIKLAGGWPVIEGVRWTESNFDWIRSSAVLRKLGYYYSIFVDMQIDVDPNNASIPILKVVPPNLWDFSSRNFDKIDFMTEVAEAFGAFNRKEVSMEMTQANGFLLQMQFESHSKHTQISYRKYTVEEYQQKFGSGLVDWLLFINNIVGRSSKITKDDYVLFPTPELFKSWFEFISKQAKRIQANYMMWKVIEESLPYLTEDLRDRKARTSRESRESFCFEETQRRFVPDPIEVIYARKLLPSDKRSKIEHIVTSIKAELIETVQNHVKWLDEPDRKNLLERIDNIKVIIGQPGNYLDDKLLNDSDVDMVETKNQSFLSLLSQATRNRQSKIYNQIKGTQEEYLSERWYLRGGNKLPFYSEDDNLLYIPTAVTKNYLYNEGRPQYLNYGALGAQLSYQLSGVVGPTLRKQHPSNRTNEDLAKISQCFSDESKNSQNANVVKVESIFQQIFARLVYTAYEKWVKNNNEESKLVGVEYTPNQLFWITTVSVVCEPGAQSSAIQNGFVEYVRGSPQFMRDFGCPATSGTLEKCHVFSN